MSPVQNVTHVPVHSLLRKAWFTDLIGSDLELRHKLSRYTPKRFTVPAWSDEQREWATSTLRRFLKRAQILADTFHDRWCHAALKSRKTDSDGQEVHLNRGNQDVFVVKTRTEWMEAETA
jgi:hypothetical protein